MNPTPPTSTDRAPSRRTRLWRLLLMVTVLMCAAGAWAFVQWERPPAYWQAARLLLLRDQAATAAAAEDLERRLVGQVTRIGRDGDTDVIEITYAQANAWLMKNLRPWAAHQEIQIPKPLGQMILAPQGEAWVLGIAIKTAEIDQIISIGFDLQLLDSGQAALHITSVRAGRLPIPIASVLAHLRKSGRADSLAPFERLVAGEPFDPVTSHPGHAVKRLRLVGISTSPLGIKLTLKAEAP